MCLLAHCGYHFILTDSLQQHIDQMLSQFSMMLVKSISLSDPVHVAGEVLC